LKCSANCLEIKTGYKLRDKSAPKRVKQYEHKPYRQMPSIGWLEKISFRDQLTTVFL
jgi:hypothetical protein